MGGYFKWGSPAKNSNNSFPARKMRQTKKKRGRWNQRSRRVISISNYQSLYLCDKKKTCFIFCLLSPSPLDLVSFLQTLVWVLDLLFIFTSRFLTTSPLKCDLLSEGVAFLFLPLSLSFLLPGAEFLFIVEFFKQTKGLTAVYFFFKMLLYFAGQFLSTLHALSVRLLLDAVNLSWKVNSAKCRPFIFWHHSAAVPLFSSSSLPHSSKLLSPNNIWPLFIYPSSHLLSFSKSQQQWKTLSSPFTPPPPPLPLPSSPSVSSKLLPRSWCCKICPSSATSRASERK